MPQQGGLTLIRGQWMAQPRPQSAGPKDNGAGVWPESHSMSTYKFRAANVLDPAAARAVASHNGTGFHTMAAAGATAGSGAASRHRHEYLNKFGSTVVAADAAPGRKLLFHAGARPKRSHFGDGDRASLAAARSQPNFHEPPAVASTAPPKRPTFDEGARYTRTSFATSTPRLLAWNPSAPSNTTFGLGTRPEGPRSTGFHG